MHGRREEVERLIYEFVNEYAEQNKVYPSYREIANGGAEADRRGIGRERGNAETVLPRVSGRACPPASRK